MSGHGAVGATLNIEWFRSITDTEEEAVAMLNAHLSQKSKVGND